MSVFFSRKYLLIAISILLVMITSFLLFFLHSNASKNAVINGVFILPTTIPPDSSITLLVRDVSSGGSFTPVGNYTVRDLSTWQYTTGMVGKSYEIKAQLSQNGNTITSSSMMVTAPALNQILKFDTSPSISAATSPSPIQLPVTQIPKVLPTNVPTVTAIPTPTPVLVTTSRPTPIPITSNTSSATISGTIAFSGQAPVSSRIVIFQRISGTTNYQVAVDNLAAYNASSWFWSSGLPSKSYDFIAVLKQKQTNGTDIDLATSNTLTVTAPSATGVLTLTYAPTLATPGPNITVTCNALDGSSQTWPASIAFQTITGAASYWFQIGTTDGGIELTNFTQNALSGSNQILTEHLKNGTTYYAKYAYAGVPNLLSGNSQFSLLSSSAQLKCQ